jgi:hypothetical protein
VEVGAQGAALQAVEGGLRISAVDRGQEAAWVASTAYWSCQVGMHGTWLLQLSTRLQ